MPLADLDLRPDDRKLKQFGFTTVLMTALLALLGVFRGSILWMDWSGFGSLPGLAFALIGGYALVAAILRPGLIRPLYLSLAVLTFPIGIVLSLVVMVLLYYLLITPIALVFRVVGRDRLGLKTAPEAKTHWHRRGAENEVARYFRQF